MKLKPDIQVNSIEIQNQKCSMLKHKEKNLEYFKSKECLHCTIDVIHMQLENINNPEKVYMYIVALYILYIGGKDNVYIFVQRI